MSAQAQIVASVARRGYLDGWSDEELMARQVVKLAEELGELASTIETDSPKLGFLLAKIVTLGNDARTVFDQRVPFVGATVHSGPAAAELVDIAVVLACAAHALSISDVMAAAATKARGDVARGVRNGE